MTGCYLPLSTHEQQTPLVSYANIILFCVSMLALLISFVNFEELVCDEKKAWNVLNVPCTILSILTLLGCCWQKSNSHLQISWSSERAEMVDWRAGGNQHLESTSHTIKLVWSAEMCFMTMQGLIRKTVTSSAPGCMPLPRLTCTSTSKAA